jgi:sugar phosphate isomerase/epimerase
MKIIWSIFPKFYKHLGLQELAALVRDVGLDTTNLVVRDGYWATLNDLAVQTRTFVQTMQKEGLKVHFATAGFSPEQLREDDTPLAVLADNGIADFRMSYFKADEDVAGSFDRARADLEVLAGICEKRGVRVVYQVHHGTLITNSVAAWVLVRDLPSEWVGVMLDPGNQAREGYENWQRAARLLGDHLAAFGIKDANFVRDESKASEPRQGWYQESVPAYEGITDWHQLRDGLNAVDFDGTFVFMPFYDKDDPETMTAKLKKEVGYLREIMEREAARL